MLSASTYSATGCHLCYVARGSNVFETGRSSQCTLVHQSVNMHLIAVGIV